MTDITDPADRLGLTADSRPDYQEFIAALGKALPPRSAASVTVPDMAERYGNVCDLTISRSGLKATTPARMARFCTPAPLRVKSPG